MKMLVSLVSVFSLILFLLNFQCMTIEGQLNSQTLRLHNQQYPKHGNRFGHGSTGFVPPPPPVASHSQMRMNPNRQFNRRMPNPHSNSDQYAFQHANMPPPWQDGSNFYPYMPSNDRDGLPMYPHVPINNQDGSNFYAGQRTPHPPMVRGNNNFDYDHGEIDTNKFLNEEWRYGNTKSRQRQGAKKSFDSFDYAKHRSNRKSQQNKPIYQP